MCVSYKIHGFGKDRHQMSALPSHYPQSLRPHCGRRGFCDLYKLGANVLPWDELQMLTDLSPDVSFAFKGVTLMPYSSILTMLMAVPWTGKIVNATVLRMLVILRHSGERERDSLFQCWLLFTVSGVADVIGTRGTFIGPHFPRGPGQVSEVESAFET